MADEEVLLGVATPADVGPDLVAAGGVTLPPCEVCGFDGWPDGGMFAARSIHMRAHERRGEVDG